MKTTSKSIHHRKVVQFITVLFALSGLLIPKPMIEGFLPIFGFALVLAGIPHGAGDLLISKQLNQSAGTHFKPVKYLVGYLSLIVIYICVWFYQPLLAFLTFFLLSAYHFGQSNWIHISFPDKFVETATMIMWGLGIVGVPVLLHYDQSITVIMEMTGSSFDLPDVLRAILIFFLIFTNLGIIIHLRHQCHISAKIFQQEFWKYLLLLLLCFTTPLVVGFGLYFVLWHSLDSIRHQVAVLRIIQPDFSIFKYIRQTLPFSLMAFAGLGLIYFQFGETFDRGQNLGVLFLFISIITVPHALLMDWLYSVGKPIISSANSDIETLEN